MLLRRKPESPVILKRADYISAIRSEIAELEFNKRNLADELDTINDRMIFGKEQKLKGFIAMLKVERRMVNNRIRRADKSIKELQKLLLIADRTLG